jgi:hypothetical protein
MMKKNILFVVLLAISGTIFSGVKTGVAIGAFAALAGFHKENFQRFGRNVQADLNKIWADCSADLKESNADSRAKKISNSIKKSLLCFVAAGLVIPLHAVPEVATAVKDDAVAIISPFALLYELVRRQVSPPDWRGETEPASFESTHKQNL